MDNAELMLAEFVSSKTIRDAVTETISIESKELLLRILGHVVTGKFSSADEVWVVWMIRSDDVERDLEACKKEIKHALVVSKTFKSVAWAKRRKMIDSSTACTLVNGLLERGEGGPCESSLFSLFDPKRMGAADDSDLAASFWRWREMQPLRRDD